MSHIDVMKQALEYLQDNQHLIADNERHAYVMEYNAFVERFEQTIAGAEKQQALDKMADNAREMGLSYEQPAQQDIPDLIAGALGVSRGTAYDIMREALAEQTARPWVNATPWVGLTDEDKEFIAKRAAVYDWHDYEVIEASEAKLKEKNT